MTFLIKGTAKVIQSWTSSAPPVRPAHKPLLKDLQSEMQQLSLALLPPFDHFQDCDGSAQISAQLQHLFVRRLVVLTILRVEDKHEQKHQTRSEPLKASLTTHGG